MAAPAVAQHGQHQHAAHPAGGPLPAGWHARVDRDQPVDGVAFTTTGDTYHFVTGPAAVLYNPEWAKSGDYSFSARLRQNRSPEHPESYGIVFGGKDLSGPDQTYSYFLVRKSGDYFIATRRGAERTKVVDWTKHPAVVPEDASGVQTNVLGVRTAGDEVVFTVNGTEVTRLPRNQLSTDGIVGFRINHRLDVTADQVAR